MKNKFIKTSILALLAAGASTLAHASPSYIPPAIYTQTTDLADFSHLSSLTASNIHQVNNLRKAKTRYQDLVAQGGWKAIRSGDKLEVGSEDPRVPAIRQRLYAEGYYSKSRNYAALASFPRTETTYDEHLAGIVKAFQARNGLADDGVIGPATLAAFNESAESKLKRIDKTLADWTAYEELGDTHIWANIPSFQAQAWRNDTLDIEMNTIVGTRQNSTVAFSDEIEYMVANPKWFLPTSLFIRQKLSKLRADPSYAAKHNYRIYDRASGAELRRTRK